MAARRDSRPRVRASKEARGMTTSEQAAWALYGQLEEPDRHLVDAWRALGNDWVDSLLNSGVLRRGGRRVHPRDAEDIERLRRRFSPVPVRQETAEHEAAHAIVAEALGLRVVDIVVGEDGSGVTTHESASQKDGAVIACAGQIWIEEFRYREFPAGAGGCSGDQRALVARADAFNARIAAGKARRILHDRADEVVRLAAWLQRADSHEPPLRQQLVQAEIRRITGP